MLTDTQHEMYVQTIESTALTAIAESIRGIERACKALETTCRVEGKNRDDDYSSKIAALRATAKQAHAQYTDLCEICLYSVEPMQTPPAFNLAR